MKIIAIYLILVNFMLLTSICFSKNKDDKVILEFKNNMEYGVMLDTTKTDPIIYLIKIDKSYIGDDFLILDSLDHVDAIKQINDTSIIYGIQTMDTCRFVFAYLSNEYCLDTFEVVTNTPGYWLAGTFYQYVYSPKHSIFAYSSGPPDYEDYLNRLIVLKLSGDKVDTMGMYYNSLAPYITEGEDYLLVNMIDNDLNENSNIGIIDLIDYSVVKPLDSSNCSNWGGTYDTTSKSIYFIRSFDSTFDVNVWKYNETSGEKKITNFVDPQVVKKLYIYGDSLFCITKQVGLMSESKRNKYSYPLNEL